MKIFTKHEICEISLRPISKGISKQILNHLIEQVTSIPDHKFIKEMRKTTKLKIMSFAPGKFYIKYDEI